VAQKIRTVFIDDLDGSEADGTVRFGLDGTEYKIDLTAGHAQALRDALARYVQAAWRAEARARRPARGGRRGSGTGVDTTEVREWAKALGIEVKHRGLVPAELVVKFKAANRAITSGTCAVQRKGLAGHEIHWAGCTPESCGFRDHAADLAREGASVPGLSTQPSACQHEVAERLTRSGVRPSPVRRRRVTRRPAGQRFGLRISNAITATEDHE
jgi:Lsr2